ncbi:Phosphocarrier protein, nitrogen regulation associated [hydrothermal vent metagenome]|uniref:Phosphocarrier protein, nitrogen regulation associated n=1 Tax=hydrothermal vent metagenome TaxID=652676 RepID=A0A3B0U258_9ZZZZ
MPDGGEPVSGDAGTARAVVVICNERGLHARASAKFVKHAAGFKSVISVTKDGETVEGRSILDLMMLAAGPGASIEIAATGADAAQALAELKALVECGFDENDE